MGGERRRHGWKALITFKIHLTLSTARRPVPNTAPWRRAAALLRSTFITIRFIYFFLLLSHFLERVLTSFLGL